MLAQNFYAEACRIERRNVRTLWQMIAGVLFQRRALKPPILSTMLREMQLRCTGDLVAGRH